MLHGLEFHFLAFECVICTGQAIACGYPSIVVGHLLSSESSVVTPHPIVHGRPHAKLGRPNRTRQRGSVLHHHCRHRWLHRALPHLQAHVTRRLGDPSKI